MPSVIIPAHNEASVLGRLLDLLAAVPEGTPEAEFFVICNGCTDDTEAIARNYSWVDVISTPTPSKSLALRLGNEVATSFPRAFVDADVELDGQSLVALWDSLESGHAMAVAPSREFDFSTSNLLVRMYYRFWQDLPGVQQGLFGRGVIAVSKDGYERLGALPDFIADDLAASAAFSDAERLVVSHATVVVHPPRTWRALLRRRVRAVTGTNQFYAAAEGPSVDSRTSVADLVAAIQARPFNALRLPIFLATAVLARREASLRLRNSDLTWERDDSREPSIGY